MVKLTKAEIQEHQKWLSEWRQPEEMILYIDALMDQNASITNGVAVNLFNQPGLQFVREAWVAGRFGQQVSAAAVCISLEDKTDFVLLIDGKEVLWEITEADIPGRMRGNEYKEIFNRIKQGESEIEEYPVGEWQKDAEQAPLALKSAAVRKSKIGYPEGTNLLIYLNINEFGIAQKQIERSMLPTTSPAKDHFNEVWVMWKSRAYRLWVNGRDVLGDL